MEALVAGPVDHLQFAQDQANALLPVVRAVTRAARPAVKHVAMCNGYNKGGTGGFALNLTSGGDHYDKPAPPGLPDSLVAASRNALAAAEANHYRPPGPHASLLFLTPSF
jgi:hypothetical protein